ncbi:MAG: type II toxin-antitoxin system RelB/DinJ family antitoxin [bacterium]|nr:type II toxin-antitoxin system RelB/DinJ family antitoxin [bacterium]
MTQLQVRIDKKTKAAAKKVLAEIGLDLSSAVKLLFKQIAKSGTLPIEIRDVNGFRPHKAAELQEALVQAKASNQGYTSVAGLMKALDE